MTKQQAEFIKEQFLSKIGGKFDIQDIATFPIMQRMLFEAGLDFNNDIRKNLEKAKAISSGKLTEVGVPVVTNNGDSFNLNIGYPIGSKQLDYYDFINQGVKGVGGAKAKPKKNSSKYSFKTKYANRAMAASIFSWLNLARKSIRADKVDLSGVQKKRRSITKVLSEADNKKRLAYAISTAIKRDGIRATYYFDRAINENFGQEFTNALATALGGDIILNIRQYGDNNNN